MALALGDVHAAPSKGMDQKFARMAAAGGMFEVKLGEVAEKKAESPAVKNFAAMMVIEHGKAGAELAALADKENLKVPKKLPKKFQSKVEKISALTGKAFDAAYVGEMVTAHTEDLAAFKEAASSLPDPALKEFARKTSVMIEGHLTAIKKIQADMTQAVSPL